MPIEIDCVCGKHLTAPDSAAGKKGKCPTCGRSVVVPDPKAEARQSARIEAADGVEVKANCLIADSDAKSMKTSISMFEEHGYRVLHSTTDSQDAIDKIRELKPDIVILDEKLRPMSGFKVIQMINDPMNPKNKGVWDVIFAMTSSKVSGREKQYALSLGVEIFVQKPFTPVQVFPRIERRLAHKKR